MCGMNFQNFFRRIESLHQRTLIRILYEFFLFFLPSLYNILYPKKVNLYLEVIVFRIVPICVMISYYLNNIKLLNVTAKTINNIGIIPTLPTTLVKKELKYDVIFSDLLSPKKIYPLA